jgi:hypothetical protein
MSKPINALKVSLRAFLISNNKLGGLPVKEISIVYRKCDAINVL